MSSDSYKRFIQRVEEIGNLDQINKILTWDQEVIMPEKGIEARSRQKSMLSRLKHRLLTDPEMEQLVDQLEDQELEEDETAILREIKREHERASKVSEELLEQISQQESECVEKWKKARAENDFSIVSSQLQQLLELKREYADQIDSESEPYKVLFKDYEPYIPFERTVDIMEKLKNRLTSLIEEVESSGREIETDAFKGDFPEENQEELNQKILDLLDFDRERARLDVSEHPFTLGNPFDCRITTRFNQNNLAESLMPTIHEYGHALYQLGLDQQNYGNPLGESRDLSVHESQSRLWENQVGRSKQFWKLILPELKQMFPEQMEDVTVEDCYQSINQYDEDNMIRTEADELSYHLHIVLRFELERKLVNGEIEVEELPELWNQKMEELLGKRPETDAEGVLQDIHWYWGSIGYFPTYSLGSVLAAQVFEAAKQDIDGLEDDIEQGEFSELQDWLRQKIHSKGKKFKTSKLIQQVTGEKLSAEPFLSYVEQKYSQLYRL